MKCIVLYWNQKFTYHNTFATKTISQLTELRCCYILNFLGGVLVRGVVYMWRPERFCLDPATLCGKLCGTVCHTVWQAVCHTVSHCVTLCGTHSLCGKLCGSLWHTVCHTVWQGASSTEREEERLLSQECVETFLLQACNACAAARAPCRWLRHCDVTSGRSSTSSTICLF